MLAWSQLHSVPSLISHTHPHPQHNQELPLSTEPGIAPDYVGSQKPIPSPKKKRNLSLLLSVFLPLFYSFPLSLHLHHLARQKNVTSKIIMEKRRHCYHDLKGICHTGFCFHHHCNPVPTKICLFCPAQRNVLSFVLEGGNNSFLDNAKGCTVTVLKC